MSTRSDVFKPLLMGEHPIPGIWSFLLPEDFSYLRLPKEEKSSCGQCPQIEKQGFRSDYRCCTYFPRIPNFMLGLALREGVSERVALVRRLIDGNFVLPEGTQASPGLWKRSIIQNSEEKFGRGDDVLCPFLDKIHSMCGIHNYRGSVCSTFFCELDHGGVSEDFWDQLQSLMLQLESALAQHLMEKQGFSLASYFGTFDQWAARLDECSLRNGAWSEEIYALLWQDFAGTEEDFLLSCADYVLEHLDELFDIASSQKIHQTQLFEKASYESVPRRHHGERDREPYVEGVATPIPQLWYQLQAQHKNLWNFPLDSKLKLPSDLRFEENPKDASVSSYYQKYPFRLVRMERFYMYLDEKEHDLLIKFKDSPVLDSQLLDEIGRSYEDPRDRIAQWLNKKILEIVD